MTTTSINKPNNDLPLYIIIIFTIIIILGILCSCSKDTIKCVTCTTITFDTINVIELPYPFNPNLGYYIPTIKDTIYCDGLQPSNDTTITGSTIKIKYCK